MGKKITILAGLFLLTALSAWASPPERAAGWCEQGNQVVVTNGSSSTTKVQRSYPQCTVTVYFHGTTTIAPIYSDNAGTQLANPFVASSAGYWFFYANDSLYDIQLSGSSFATPYTIGGVRLFSYLTPGDFNAVCDGTTDDTAALQALVAGAGGGMVHFTQPCVLNANLTFPSTLDLQFDNGGQIIVGSGDTLIINGSVTAGIYKIFSGSGSVIVGSSQTQLIPQWWGADSTGFSDSAPAINAALTSACAVSSISSTSRGGKVYLPPGKYLVNSTVATAGRCEGIEFSGISNSEITGIGSQLIWGGAANGTVFNVYSTGWSKFHDFQINGGTANSAGVGLLFDADTINPVVRSSQKDIFDHIYVINVTGTPGNCVQVGRSTSGDDVSQSLFSNFTVDHCSVGIYQDGGQTVQNIYSQNEFGSSISTYGVQIVRGDTHLKDNAFIGGGPSTKIANVYIGPLSVRANLDGNYYEDLGSLDPTVFSNYLFAQGGNPNRPFPTYLMGERVEWVLKGGKVLDYEQAGPITIISHTADDIIQPQDPGQYWINSGTGCCTVYADLLGGWLSSPSQIVSVGNNVVVHTDSAANQLMSNVFEGYDASITSGSAVLTIGASHSFTSSMVGYVCYVQNYLTGNIAQQNAIVGFTDSTHVTLANASTNTLSPTGMYYRCGRLLNVGQGNTVVSDTINLASSVVEGQTPQYQLRRFLFGTAWQNWSWRVDSVGGHLSLMSTDSPLTSTYSPFITMIPSGGSPSSVTLEVPTRIGSSTYQKMGIFFQDFTGINPGTIAANSSFTTSLTLTVDTVTPGADWCQVFVGTYTAGIISTCIIQTANKAQMSLYNVTSGPINPGTNTYRVIVNKFSYTGP